jgi:hypothetical protein
VEIKDILVYNTDVKISGNHVEIKHYGEKQIKGYSVDRSGKKSLKAKYDVILNMIKEKKQESVEWLDDNEFHLQERLYLKTLESYNQTLLENQKSGFLKSNRRAKTQIMDLVSSNVYKWKDFEGKKQRLKFLTLTFNPKLYDSDLEQYTVEYRENKNGGKYPVEVPIHGYGFRNMLSDFKYCYGEITKFFKRLSFKLYDLSRNVIKYICVPELHKVDKIFHFHLILFNMPYLSHDEYIDIWGLGGVNIKAVTGSPGKVGKYVSKYISKSQEETNADFEEYKTLGLENMKRYSASRGLYKPFKRSYMSGGSEMKDAIRELKQKRHLEKLNADGDVVEVKTIESDERGSIMYVTFRINNKKALESFRNYADVLTNGSYVKRKKEWVSRLDKYEWAMMFDKNYRYGDKSKRPPSLNKDNEISKNQVRTFDFFKNRWSIKPVII